jgi:uncharacterized protein (DUF4415 family)
LVERDNDARRRVSRRAYRLGRKTPTRRSAETEKDATFNPLQPEVIEYFRATGEGWQARMDAALKEWIKVHSLA